MNILLITDLHHSGPATGFHQQPRWVNAAPRLIDRLRGLIATHKIDLLISLGDLVEGGNPPQIREIVDLLKPIEIPTLLCLGNHDLAQPNSFAAWQTALPAWPHAMVADSLLETPALDIIALNTHWLDADGHPQLHWSGTAPIPAVTNHQLTNLRTWLARNPDRPALLAMHCPLDPLPPALTGLPAPIHDSPASFTAPLLDLLNQHPRAKLVFAGHCHATCCTRITSPHPRAHFSLAAFGEVPCQYALLTIAPDSVSVSIQSLNPTDADAPALDPAKLWATGRDSDRTLTL